MSRARELFDRLITGGENEVENFINQKITEELFLDYKRSANNGSGASLDNKDKSNLSKAISGFGNSEGGVIVWGVDCRSDPALGDVPNDAVHIENPKRFKSWLEQVTGGVTVPPHTGVLHHAIDSKTPNKGFVVTFIPSGVHSPYQTIPELSYYIRAGSNFSKAPHAVLSGMFGRRPQSSIRHHFFAPKKPILLPKGRIQTQLGINIHNFGRGIAENFFLNLDMVSHPGSNCQIEFQPSDERDVWWGRFALERSLSVIAKGGYHLPPEAYVMPVSLKIQLAPPFEDAIVFEGACGAADSEIWKFKFECDQEQLIKAHAAFVDTSNKNAAADFNKIFFEKIKI